MNHDMNSEPIGRVMAARMDKEEDGSHYVRLQVAITDPVAIEKVLDKRYLTGSVGGRAGKAVCSISGEDLAKIDETGKPKMSRYKRGQVYKGKLAYVDMQDIAFKEYSFVNQPADSKSSVRVINPSDGTSVSTSDSQWVAKSSAFVLHMDKEDIVSVEENQSVLSSLKKKESKPLYLHVKGAFLSAMAVQESENYNYKNSSLLSNENNDNEEIDSCQEKSKMDEISKEEDILAAVEDLSEDLSAIASSAQESEVSDEPKEEVQQELEEIKEEELEASANSDVSAKEAIEGAAAAVQRVLNDSVVFALAAQRAHWNVVGEDFEQYHALFASIYEDVFGNIDAIAEEIRKMDVMVESLTNMVMNASFKDDVESSDPMELCKGLLEKNTMLNQNVLSAFTTCSEANAQGTADLMAQRDGMHKKWSWQLKSSLKEEVGEPADESWREIGSSAKVEEKEELSNEVDSNLETEAKEGQDSDVHNTELTGKNSASEQVVEELTLRVQNLEEENKKLKGALHRTLAERVVDAKIAAGVEEYENRQVSIGEHVQRSAASLADSLRDLAKMPVAKSGKQTMPQIDSSVNVVEGEENVITVDRQEEEVIEENTNKTPEEIFVDALMGRRKL